MKMMSDIFPDPWPYTEPTDPFEADGTTWVASWYDGRMVWNEIDGDEEE